MTLSVSMNGYFKFHPDEIMDQKSYYAYVLNPYETFSYDAYKRLTKTAHWDYFEAKDALLYDPRADKYQLGIGPYVKLRAKQTKNRSEGVIFTDWDDLIWKRTVASQMVNAEQKRVSVRFQVGDALFASSGMTIVFPGFLRAYVEGTDDPEAALENREVPLPALNDTPLGIDLMEKVVQE